MIVRIYRNYYVYLNNSDNNDVLSCECYLQLLDVLILFLRVMLISNGKVKQLSSDVMFLVKLGISTVTMENGLESSATAHKASSLSI